MNFSIIAIVIVIVMVVVMVMVIVIVMVMIMIMMIINQLTIRIRVSDNVNAKFLGIAEHQISFKAVLFYQTSRLSRLFDFFFI